MTSFRSDRSGAPDDPDLFRRADAVFDAALDLEPERRAAYVERACAGDDALRAAVERLLAAHANAGDFLAEAADSGGVVARALEGHGHLHAEHGNDDVLGSRLKRALGDRYRVERRVARGGMATVYRAFDVRHERPVAVKVLDARLGDALESGADRFLAEIRTTANLRHPHILPLFDSGAADGILYYVMPLVDGETLRQRLVREAPLPVDDAVRIARAVAGALAHAHARGVVHRDLKPENILLQDGEPIVADFGIALAVANAGGERVTRAGFVLGTPQYMAPEQASGAVSVDSRVDTYALGAVTYEMLTGDPPHVAGSARAVLAKRRSERPTPVRVLRDSVPEHVERAVHRALEIVPADRFATVSDFGEALVRGGGAPVTGARTNGGNVRASRRVLAMAALAVAGLAIALGIAAWSARGGTAAGEANVAATRFVVAPIPDAAIGRAPTITPDGDQLVYPGAAETNRRLFVRPVNELEARPLAGTEGALSAFLSPDGKWVAFLTSDDRLKKVSIDGGPVTELTGAFRYVTASWGRGDHIVTGGGTRGMTWVSANGGPVHPLTMLDSSRRETRHAGPLVLDDGRSVVFTAERDRNGPVANQGELAVVTLDPGATTPTRHTLLGVQASRAVAVVDDWLLFTSSDHSGLMAVRFDRARRAVSGSPKLVLKDPEGGIGSATLARNGTLLYTRSGGGNRPVLVDSSGTAQPMFAGVRGGFMNPRYSPDGRRLVIQGTSPQGADAWIFDVASGTSTRVTTAGTVVGPTWTPDGRRIVYLSMDGGRSAFWSQPIDASQPPERIVVGEGLFAADVTPDGQSVVFQRQLSGAWSIWSAPVHGDGRLRPVVLEKFDAYMPAISPDGRWLAYAANVTGRYEVYVRPYPGPGSTVQVSTEGGTEPAWTRDGRTILFRADRRMYAATIAARPELVVTRRVALFTDAFDGDMPMPHRNFDVSPDARHYVMIEAAADAVPQTVVVLGWLKELRTAVADVR